METKKNPGGKITRLEIMLAAWEDVMFFLEMDAAYCKASKPKEYKRRKKLFDPNGPVGQWRTFRRYLLQSVQDASENKKFDCGRFMPDPQLDPGPLMIELHRRKWKMYDPLLAEFFPSLLWCWMNSSRRVFSLSEDLQTLINATSLEGVFLKDLKLPFDSFVIELPTPIEGVSGNRYDMILFAQTEEKIKGVGNGGVGFLLSESCSNYTPFTLKFKRSIEELARRKNWKEMERKLAFMEKHLCALHNILRMMFWDQTENDVLVLKHVVAYSEQGRIDGAEEMLDDVAYQQALRILAGVSLYLRTLPPVSKNRTDWKRVDLEPLAMPVQAVTDEAQVCMLSTEFTLSPQERIILGGREVNEELAGGTKKNPHFRRGFWKRPHGQGNNPDAEKTIWVRPTIVNLHLLKEGELPLGASTILLGSKRRTL